MRQAFDPSAGRPQRSAGPTAARSGQRDSLDASHGGQRWRAWIGSHRRWRTPLAATVALLVGIGVGAGISPSQAGELDEATTANERLAGENTTLTNDNEALRAESEDLRTRLGTAESDVARLRSEAAGVAAQAAELTTREAALAQRQGEVDAAAAAVAQREAAVAAAEDAAAARPPVSSGITSGGAAGQVSGAFRNCDAARAAGAAPVRRGDPGYGPHLDRDDDGVGCE